MRFCKETRTRNQNAKRQKIVTNLNCIKCRNSSSVQLKRFKIHRTATANQIHQRNGNSGLFQQFIKTG